MCVCVCACVGVEYAREKNHQSHLAGFRPWSAYGGYIVLVHRIFLRQVSVPLFRILWAGNALLPPAAGLRRDLTPYSNHGHHPHFDSLSASTGSHCVTLAGWGRDAASGLDYWIIRNSWGAGFGTNGYYR